MGRLQPMTDQPRILTTRWPNPCTHNWQIPWPMAQVRQCTHCGAWLAPPWPTPADNLFDGQR
jgi:hypothetical protein